MTGTLTVSIEFETRSLRQVKESKLIFHLSFSNFHFFIGSDALELIENWQM